MFESLKQIFQNSNMPSQSRQIKVYRLGILMVCLFILFVGFQNCKQSKNNKVSGVNRCPAGQVAGTNGVCQPSSQDEPETPELNINVDSQTLDSITWNWICTNNDVCTYAHTISESSSQPTFEDTDFDATKTANKAYDATECTSPPCSYYLYVQAKRSSDGEKSSILMREKDLGPNVNVTVSPGDSEQPQTSVTWEWTCNQPPCQFRHIINTDATHAFAESDTYGDEKTATQTGEGIFYLHVQAQKDTIESQVESIQAVLKSDKAQIANGMFHSCYLKSGGVKCWGSNNRGQLGLKGGNADSKFRIGDQANEMQNLQPIELGGRAIAIDLAEGAYWSNCSKRCNEDPTLGGTTGSATTTKEECLKICQKRNMDRQGKFTCTLLEEGDVKCWGANGAGQLGQGHKRKIGDDANEITRLEAIDLGHKTKAITVGGHHACALLENDHVKCWGANNFGQLGYNGTDAIGDNKDEMGDFLPFVGGKSFKVKAITAGHSYTCAIMQDDNVKCWGQGSFGMLGQDNTEHIGDEPNEMASLNPVNLGQNAKSITAGAYHTCAVLFDDSVKCWGANSEGQLGQGHRRHIGRNSGDMAGLQAINFGTNLTVKTVVAGLRHTCALFSDDNMRCWGLNGAGQLGIGNITGQNLLIGDITSEMGASLASVAKGTTRRVASISAGGYNSCFILDNDNVKCWGHNWAGQLGQGNITTKETNLNLGDNEVITRVNPIPLRMDGICGTERNTCFVGEADDQAVDDSDNHHKWSCSGVNGGNANKSCTSQI